MINFKEATCKFLNAEHQFCTAMGTLVFREKDSTLHSIGGVNSEGSNFWMKLGDKKWNKSVREHSIVANESALELVNNSAIYFA
jgi:hypothetical protein